MLRDVALARQQAAAVATGDVWTAAYEKLVGAMRELIKNLEEKLAKDDPRWLAFGLNLPATPATPARPQNVTVQADETGALAVQCEVVALEDAAGGGADGVCAGGAFDGAHGGDPRGGAGADGADRGAGGEWGAARGGE